MDFPISPLPFVFKLDLAELHKDWMLGFASNTLRTTQKQWRLKRDSASNQPQLECLEQFAADLSIWGQTVKSSLIPDDVSSPFHPIEAMSG